MCKKLEAKKLTLQACLMSIGPSDALGHHLLPWGNSFLGGEKRCPGALPEFLKNTFDRVGVQVLVNTIFT